VYIPGEEFVFIPSTADQLASAPLDELMGEITQAIGSVAVMPKDPGADVTTVHVGLGGGLSRALAAAADADSAAVNAQLSALREAHPHMRLTCRLPSSSSSSTDDRPHESSQEEPSGRCFPSSWCCPQFFPHAAGQQS
jgi:hypothetical protein